ncbi:MAG: exo-alpha-sialidase [Brevinema sp.]
MSIYEKIKNFALALVDEKKAKVIVPAMDSSSGFWFGGGNMVEDREGILYVSGRFRNFGDSRIGITTGDRGGELAIFSSKDQGKSFQKIHSIFKKDLPGGVLSIEGTALHFNKNGDIELFVSSEKLENSYPEHLKHYLKPNTGVWTIDIITAKTICELTSDKIKPLLSCKDSQFIQVKDPFYYTAKNGDEYLMFCTHPFNWTSSNTGYMKRKNDNLEFETPVWEFFRRGYTWDVAITRGTYITDLPKVGVFEGKDIRLLFYDGGECVRNLDEHVNSVKRPRGYSCEELGGLAYTENGDLHNFTRISVDAPLFVSPYGTSCSRYVTTLTTKDGMYAIWQQSQEDLSQPLVINFLGNEEIKQLLS